MRYLPSLGLFLLLGKSVLSQPPAAKEEVVGRATFQPQLLRGEVGGEKWVENQRMALLSKDNLVRLIKQRGLEGRWRALGAEAAVEKLKGMVSARLEPGSEVITVEARSSITKEADELANGLVEVWSEWRMDAKKAALTQELDQLDKAVELEEQRLEEARLKLLTLLKKRETSAADAGLKLAQVAKLQELLIGEETKLMSLKTVNLELSALDQDLQLRFLLLSQPGHPTLMPAWQRCQDLRFAAMTSKQKSDQSGLKAANDALQDEFHMCRKMQDVQVSISEKTCANLQATLTAAKLELAQAQSTHLEIDSATKVVHRLEGELDRLSREISQRRLDLALEQSTLLWHQKAGPFGN